MNKPYTQHRSLLVSRKVQKSKEKPKHVTEIKKEPVTNLELSNPQTSFSVQKRTNEGARNEDTLLGEISDRMEKMEDEKGLSMWRCKVCGKIVRRRHKMMLHVEIHIEGFNHKCAHCYKVLKTTGALQGHMRLLHKGLK